MPAMMTAETHNTTAHTLAPGASSVTPANTKADAMLAIDAIVTHPAYNPMTTRHARCAEPGSDSSRWSRTNRTHKTESSAAITSTDSHNSSARTTRIQAAFNTNDAKNHNQERPTKRV